MGRIIGLSAIVIAIFGSGSSIGSAQELTVDQSKVYLSDSAECRSQEDKTKDASDHDVLSLSFKDGIGALGLWCQFVDVKSSSRSNSLFVDALCWMPGDEVYPDTLSITPMSETTIRVFSTNDAMMALAGKQTNSSLTANIDPTAQPGVTMYTSCDILSETPVD